MTDDGTTGERTSETGVSGAAEDQDQYRPPSLGRPYHRILMLSQTPQPVDSIVRLLNPTAIRSRVRRLLRRSRGA